MNHLQTMNKQLQLPLSVKEEGMRLPRKRVDIVSVQLVKESSLLYANRVIRSPRDAAALFREFLGALDREYFVCISQLKSEPFINLKLSH